MIPKAVLCHILVVWGLAQVTAQVNHEGNSVAVRSSMIANGWRPLTVHESENSGTHSNLLNDRDTINKRHSGPHPVHEKLHEHMTASKKITAKQNNKHIRDYNPPSILSFSLYGNSITKRRPEATTSRHVQNNNHVFASETREFSFLVPPPRELVRYGSNPYRKVILHDNKAYLRQPFQQYIISHTSVQPDVRNSLHYQKDSVVGSVNTHGSTTLKNRPLISNHHVGGIQQPQGQQQQSQQQHVPFESLKLSNTNFYLQPSSVGDPVNFGHDQQATGNVYERYPSSLSSQSQQLNHDGPGNFYSQINHPAPSYDPQTFEKDQAFLVHESHDVNYATPALPVQTSLSAYAKFRPSSLHSNIQQSERHSTMRSTTLELEKFIPSKLDNMHHHQQQNYGQFRHNIGNLNSNNSILTLEQPYSNGIANTYYISEQQSLTPPATTWTLFTKNNLTSQLNKVLPNTNRPAPFYGETANVTTVRPNQEQVQNFLFSRPDVQQPQQLQQQHYVGNSLVLINQLPGKIYETPESLSLKHFNEQQFRLQQQLLQRDRDRLHEEELHKHQQQIELERLTTTTDRARISMHPSSQTPMEYMNTTVTNVDLHNQNEDFQKISGQQHLLQEYQGHVSQSIRPDVEKPAALYKVTQEPENEVSQQFTEMPSAGHRTRLRKPSTETSQEQHRRRKPTSSTTTKTIIASYNNTNYHQEEQYHLSTVAPDPIFQSPGTSYFNLSSTLPSTTKMRSTNPLMETTPTIRKTTSTATLTTPRSRPRRPTSSSGSPGRRRRPTITTKQEPDVTNPSVTYQQEEFTRNIETESEGSRRRKIKPSSEVAHENHYEIEPTTSTGTKKFDLENYGHKLATNEQGYATESPESYSNKQNLSQQIYTYNNEHDSLLYTENYKSELSPAQASADNETPGYSTSSTILQTPGELLSEGVTIDNSEVSQNIYSNVPLEELYVTTERIQTTTTPLLTPSSPRKTTTKPETIAPTRNILSRTTTRIPASISVETSLPMRASSLRIRPIHFGSNSTRPRFSIKDYKSRLDYRNRMSTTTSETPSSMTNGRQKNGGLNNHQETESGNQPAEATTSRYRHMSRVSYRMTSTKPSSYHSRRGGDFVNSTAGRIYKFTPKRRKHNNHLNRSELSTTTTVTPTESWEQDGGHRTTDAISTRHTIVRNENIFSSAIRRRPPHMKPPVAFTPPSDIKNIKKNSAEMKPEESSFHPVAISQLLTDTGIDSWSKKSNVVDSTTKGTESSGPAAIMSTNNLTEISSRQKDVTLSSQSNDNAPITVDDMNITQYLQVTTTKTSKTYEIAGQTEDLVEENSHATIDSQFEEYLFAKASQSVADLTSSASALYDKPGMFKAVSLSPSGAEGTPIINSHFRINQEKPKLPIEAFFHEISKKN